MMIEVLDHRNTLSSISAAPATSTVPFTPTISTTPTMEIITQPIFSFVSLSPRKTAARIGMKIGFIAPSSEETEPVRRLMPSICRQKERKYPSMPMASSVPACSRLTGLSAPRTFSSRNSAGIATRYRSASTVTGGIVSSASLETTYRLPQHKNVPSSGIICFLFMHIQPFKAVWFSSL